MTVYLVHTKSRGGVRQLTDTSSLPYLPATRLLFSGRFSFGVAIHEELNEFG